ncbi:MAG: hypothetical protein IJI44_07510 [Erysipelotrichaceae bacterium]|nr:hypothetical protein [Erysipelotrichaceae bacterium]
MCFEKNDALYYVMEVLLHTKNGSIMPGCDWYGFFAWGLKSTAIVIPLFLLFACLILYRLGKNRHNQEEIK